MDSTAVWTGFAVGAVAGVTGVGPLQIGVFRQHPALAIGTDLWFAAPTKGGGAVAHARRGHVDLQIDGLLLCASLPPAGLTAMH